MREITEIDVHCSATVEGNNIKEATIESWHKKRFKKIGGKHIGYHVLVYLDGEIVKTKSYEFIGQHVAGANSNSIGVCYIGGLDKKLKPKDTRTPAQKEALIKVLTQLKHMFPKAVIKGHRDHSPDLDGDGIIEPFEFLKSCPCFDAMTEYKHIK